MMERHRSQVHPGVHDDAARWKPCRRPRRSPGPPWPWTRCAAEVDQPVLLGPGRHPLYAKAAGGHGTGDGGEDLAADLDLASVIL